MKKIKRFVLSHLQKCLQTFVSDFWYMYMICAMFLCVIIIIIHHHILEQRKNGTKAIIKVTSDNITRLPRAIRKLLAQSGLSGLPRKATQSH